MATHCQSMKSLEEYFVKASKEKEELEAKLQKALDLQNELAELKSSPDFLPLNEIDQLKMELSSKEVRLSRSITLAHQMRQVEESIASIKDSVEYLKPGKVYKTDNLI